MLLRMSATPVADGTEGDAHDMLLAAYQDAMAVLQRPAPDDGPDSTSTEGE